MTLWSIIMVHIILIKERDEHHFGFAVHFAA
jgi:hypothetical protein